MPLALNIGNILAGLPVAQFDRETRSIRQAFERLGDWLQRQTSQFRGVESALAGIPIVSFSGMAVEAWIHRPQQGAFDRRPGTRHRGAFVEFFRTAWGRFTDGLGLMVRLTRQELLPLRLFRTLSRMLELVTGAMARFPNPTPGMFDPRRATRASDWMGQLALFLRLSLQSQDRIQEFFDGSLAMLKALGMGKKSAGGGGGGSGLFGFGDIPLLIGGAILAIPTVLDLIAATAASWILAGKIRLLQEFRKIEQRIFLVLRRTLDFIYKTLRPIAAEALRIVQAAKSVVLGAVAFIFDFALIFVKELFTALKPFLSGIAVFMNYLIDVIKAIPQMIRRIRTIEVVPQITIPLPPLPGLPSSVTLPPITIGDLLDWVDNPAAMRKVRDALLTLLSPLTSKRRVDIPGTNRYLGIPEGLRKKAEDLSEVIRIGLTPTAVPKEGPPAPKLAQFPDLYKAFFGPGAPDIESALKTFAKTTTGAVTDIFDAAQAFLAGSAKSMRRAAAAVVALPSPEQIREIGKTAGGFAERLFGPPKNAKNAPGTELAHAFEAALTRVGFQAVARAIPIYIGELLRVRREQLEAEKAAEATPPPPPPTSPHIPFKREQVRRVVLERVVVRAPRREVDGALTDAVALRFKQEIEAAFAARLREVPAGA